MDFFNIEDSFRDFNLLKSKIKIIPSIFSLLKLFMKYHIDVKARDVSDVLKKKETAACRYINVDLNLIITLHIRTAIVY